MTGSEITMNFVIGLVSGIVSGLVVTIFYRNRDNKKLWLNQLHYDKQSMSTFLNNLRNEIEFLIEGSSDKADVIRMVQDPPKFPSFVPKKIKLEHHHATASTYLFLKEIGDHLGNKNYVVNENQLRAFKSKLIKYQIEILSINPK